MRRALILSFAVMLAAASAARVALADSTEQKLKRARSERAAAERALADEEAHLQGVMDRYHGLQADLDQAAADVVEAYHLQDAVAAELAAAQQRLDDRVTAAYEFGPSAAIDMFLGAQSPSDFTSAQVYAQSTFQVDDSSVSDITQLKHQLQDVIATREARERQIAASVAQVQKLADQATAAYTAARQEATDAGLKVARLKEKERELEAARAAAAAALARFLASGGVSPGCASGQVHDLIVAAFSSIDQVPTALAVATRESNCRPDAYNPTVVPPYGNASGVFQILNPGIWEQWSAQCGQQGASPFDAAANVAVAACIVADQGWWPWGV